MKKKSQIQADLHFLQQATCGFRRNIGSDVAEQILSRTCALPQRNGRMLAGSDPASLGPLSVTKPHILQGTYSTTNKPGLGFCHGKKYFCQDSGKNQ